MTVYITRGICPHCFLRRGGVPKKEWEPILTSEKGFQVLQTHLDLLHQEVSCSVLDILQPFQLTLLSDKIVLLNEFSIQALFLRLFCHLCRLGQCQSEFHNPVRRGEARLNSTMAHLEWRQGQRIAQLDSRRGNKATGPGAIGLNWQSLQDLPSGKEKRQG